MRAQRTGLLAPLLLTLMVLTSPLAAQQGTLTGRVTDEQGQPVDAAQISVLGTGTGGLTDAAGRYSLSLPAGSYSLVVNVVGFREQRFDGIRVASGQATSFNIQLTSMAYELDPVVITASRAAEKETDAPATTFTVGEIELDERPVTTPAEHLRLAPGVDIITHGLQASNVVVRGFNNIFSGALHMLHDYRLAGVPSLRVNLLHFIPSNQADLARMEVVLGPASALYGPNTANGVVHIITKSPLDDQGTTVTVGGGQRNVFQGSFRSAFLLSDDFGLKVSGQYLKGDEWEFDDPTEVTNRLSADQNPQRCIADKQLRGITDVAAAQAACDRIGIRDYDLERYGVEARADWRFADNGTLVATYGRNNSSGVELTGLGSGQTVDWVYEFYQARLNFDRFFAQAYLNTSDAGESYLLNSGVPLVDRSKLFVGQLQHGFSLADGRQDFTYGFDYLGTRPETEGNINGVYEDDDDIDEWGLYLQSKTGLADQLDLILAGRLDNHSILAENVYSPRAALVFRPAPEQTLRLSYNQAYSSPSTLNYFLDIGNGFAPGGAGALGFGLRAYGTGREGWSLMDPTSGMPYGFRSPFNPAGADQMLPWAATTAFWQAAVGVLQVQVDRGDLPPDLAPILQMLAGLSPGPTDLGTMLFHPIDSTLVSLGQANLPAVPSIADDNTETYEIGWTGIIDGRVKIAADVYRTTRNNFVSPLLVQNPLVTYNGQDVGDFITVPIVTAITQQLIAAGLDPATAQQQAQQQAQVLVPLLAAGIAQVPIGVVSAPFLPGGSDLVVTYRNVGDLTLYGADLAFQWFLTDRWTLNGTYSWVSDDTFPIEFSKAPISLNAPKHKGSVAIAYRDVTSGFSAQTRFRYSNAFPAISAGFEGDVPSTKVVDMNLGYRVPNTGAELQLSVNNVFNSNNESFVGVPSIGRFAMVRVKYDLF